MHPQKGMLQTTLLKTWSYTVGGEQVRERRQGLMWWVGKQGAVSELPRYIQARDATCEACEFKVGACCSSATWRNFARHMC